MEYKFSDKISSLKPSAIREILKATADPNIIPFAAGNPAPEAFPIDAINQITEDIFENEPISALQYSITEGYPKLISTIKKMLKKDYNIGTEDDEVIIVSGAQQGIELACKCLCNEGDIIISENPSFIGSLNSFRSFNAQLIGVPLQEDGMDLVLLEKALKENKNVKLIYTITNFQNPSGITTSLEKREKIYTLAKEYNVVIIEDNPYGDLSFDNNFIPAIKTMDITGNVIYCGSFSKTIAPGLRVGFICANKQIVAKMTVAKQGEDVHTNILAQMIANNFIEKYDYKAHLAKLRLIYKNKADLMINQIKKCFPKEVKVTIPTGGLFIWCTLPESCDMLDFCKQAVKRGVAVVPGNAFLPNPTDITTSFRMNFSTPTDENIIKGTEILGDVLKEFIK